jgi:hypothetical protein
MPLLNLDLYVRKVFEAATSPTKITTKPQYKNKNEFYQNYNRKEMKPNILIKN